MFQTRTTTLLAVLICGSAALGAMNFSLHLSRRWDACTSYAGMVLPPQAYQVLSIVCLAAEIPMAAGFLVAGNPTHSVKGLSKDPLVS